MSLWGHRDLPHQLRALADLVEDRGSVPITHTMQLTVTRDVKSLFWPLRNLYACSAHMDKQVCIHINIKHIFFKKNYF